MPVMSTNKVEIIASSELINTIADIGNDYKLDRKATDSYHVKNNFFTPFYSANKDFELNEAQQMLNDLNDSDESYAKSLVLNVTNLPGFKREIVLKAIDKCDSNDWFEITKSIESEIKNFESQANMYFDARHQTDKNPDFQGANIPSIENIEIEHNADENGNSKLSFTYLTRYAPDYLILQIIASTVNQKQQYELSKSAEYKFADMAINSFSLTEDSFASRFKLLMSVDSININTNEDYALADVYGFTEDFNEFKNHINEITDDLSYKPLGDDDIEHLFVATQVRTVMFTDYTYEGLNIPFETVVLEPKESKLMSNLKDKPIGDSYFRTFDLLMDECDVNNDDACKEYWYETKCSAETLYAEIESKTTTSGIAPSLNSIYKIQSEFKNQNNKYVFDRLVDHAIIKGVLLLDEHTSPTSEVFELINKAVILYKNAGQSSSSLSENIDLIKSLELYRSLLEEKELATTQTTSKVKKANPSNPKF